MQDTFFISDPPAAERPRDTNPGGIDPDTLWNNVRASHEGGVYGSIGYRYPWASDEATKLVMRTHTTATSAAMLWKLAAQRGPDGRVPPARYFSIDRVFRNETVDATHLVCVFPRVSYPRVFCPRSHPIHPKSLTHVRPNSTKSRVSWQTTASRSAACSNCSPPFTKRWASLTSSSSQPIVSTWSYKSHSLASNTPDPYTEPSMEVFAWHAGLGKLVEIGNSGMFRPEMLEALGLPPDMKVYGWGLSLERPEMIRSKIKNIRELLGHKVDLNFVARNPAVRFDKM